MTQFDRSYCISEFAIDIPASDSSRTSLSAFQSEKMPFQMNLEWNKGLLPSEDTPYTHWLYLHRILARSGLPPIDGVHTSILEYLANELFDAQPEGIQSFLIQTSFLRCFNDALCSTITEGSHSKDILKHLERTHLFLVPLDETREWYCYHAFFAHFLRTKANATLDRSYVRLQAYKASCWYEQHEMCTEAIETALLAQAFTYAAELIELSITQCRSHQEHHILCQWFKQIPEEILHEHPMLSFAFAEALVLTSTTIDILHIAKLLEAAKQCWQKTQQEESVGKALAFLSLIAQWQGNQAQAFSDARQALALLPQEEVHWRGVCLISYGVEDLQAEKLDSALKMILLAQKLCLTEHPFIGTITATRVLGDIYRKQGRLHQAAHTYQCILDDSRATALDKGWAQVGLSMVLYEWNDVAGARHHLLQSLSMSKLQHILPLHIQNSLLLVRLFSAQGEKEQAQQLLDSLVPLVDGQTHAPLLQDISVWQVRLPLSSGDIAIAQQRSVAFLHNGVELPLTHQKREAMTIIRLLIAQGEGVIALLLIDTWKEKIPEQSRSFLEIMLLQALAYVVCRNTPQAQKILKEVLSIAKEEGYQRMFLDEGKPMLALLRSFLSDASVELPSYVNTLLSGFTLHVLSPSAASRHDKLLTPQEGLVLGLLAENHSYQEIARKMFVSINTVKTQIKSIYRKLDVVNRKDACERARDLSLL